MDRSEHDTKKHGPDIIQPRSHSARVEEVEMGLDSFFEKIKCIFTIASEKSFGEIVGAPDAG
jgi:hypothetical protein